jgi:hypothetical protein
MTSDKLRAIPGLKTYINTSTIDSVCRLLDRGQNGQACDYLLAVQDTLYALGQISVGRAVEDIRGQLRAHR